MNYNTRSLDGNYMREIESNTYNSGPNQRSFAYEIQQSTRKCSGGCMVCTGKCRY